MNTVKIDKKSTQVIAHRGLSGIEVENTNAAFIAAGNRSYYGIETDIYRTNDGKLVINHDGNLNRIAGEDIYVEKTSLATLQGIVLYDKDGVKDRMDLRLSTPENYLKICKKYEKHSVLELKSEFTMEEIKQIIDIVKSYDYLENTTFISFNYDNLLKIREILPNQSVQYLFWKVEPKITEMLVRDKIDVDVRYVELTKEDIDMLHSHGLKVNCWTVDSKEDAERLASWGIDFITSNIVE